MEEEKTARTKCHLVSSFFYFPAVNVGWDFGRPLFKTLRDILFVILAAGITAVFFMAKNSNINQEFFL